MHDSVLQMSVYAASRRSGAPLSVTERSALPSSGAIETRAVSYTHLTLPTICSV